MPSPAYRGSMLRDTRTCRSETPNDPTRPAPSGRSHAANPVRFRSAASRPGPPADRGRLWRDLDPPRLVAAGPPGLLDRRTRGRATAEAVREILVQAGLYSGFSAAEETLALAGEVFAERGLQFPADPPEDASLETLDRRGAALMAELHGSRATQGYASPDNPVTGPLYPAAIRYGYGEIWSRPGLQRPQRALVAIAAFTALRLPEQVAKF